MKYRIKLLFNDGREPLVSLLRLEKPTKESIKRGMDLHKADDYEIVEVI